MGKAVNFGYHTCKLDNGFDYIVKCIPFKSHSGKNQWLTQGFYFWTDSDYWAKRWGKEGNRVIGKFRLELCFKSEVLDLVGNVDHQLEFIRLKKLILDKLGSIGKDRDVTVNQVLSKLRQSTDVFPYLAVKAQDNKKIENIRFVDPHINKATMSMLTRQQICVFENARDKITLCGFIEPNDYAKKMPIS
ncbi:hypothetical protein [Planctobacterium marinum]|uniref:hypothetical protein n=1 Tax=Planctobacterium marinum TaxID=1631968 RepID=UPI001E308755|nr:hypothetical protein [Planctobacterium marinum]MCC2607734.1 hypothetical protein [Planctobacterium marinum]